jgi:peptidyl-prolyl cis-trans isomerase D
MISSFRKLAQSWVAKVLFVLLILSFGIWGIEDVVRNIWRETAVVKMEGAQIEAPEAQAAARRELQRIQRQLGPAFEPTEQIRQAVAAQAVEGLIAEAAQRIEAGKLKLVTPDQQVAEFVRSIPSFQMGGQFNRLILDQFLRQNDLSEGMFLQMVREDLIRIQMLGAVRAGAPAPEAAVNALFRWEREQRAAMVVELPLLEAPDPEPPTEAQLTRYHANNPERFSTPEMREAVVAVLSADTLAEQVEVPEADLRAAYDARRGQFGTPERRELEQALLPNEAAARELATAWAANPDFAAVTQAAQAAGGSAVAVGTVTRDDLPVPSLAEAAFGVPQGGVSAPVQSPFGWHVFRAATVTPGRESTFAEVRERLQQEVAHEKAADLAFERANRIEDAIAGGATLEEAGRRYGMAIVTVRLDAQGNDAEGAPVPLPIPVAGRPEALRAVFTTEVGRAPRLQELRQADAFIAVELRAVAPPALKPFEAVEDEVRLAFVTDAKRRFQEERAAGLLAAVRGGQTLEAAAQAANLPADRFGPFGRQPQQGAPGTVVPPELIPALFAARLNDPTMVPTPRGFAVGQLLEVIQADPAADPAALANVRRTAQQQAADDLDQQFGVALRSRAAPRINPALMQQVIP